MKQQKKSSSGITIGLDLGEHRHRFCSLDVAGRVVEEGNVANERNALAKLSARYRGALAIIEAGAHSPWVSRHLEELGWRVIVSNPRKVRAIYEHERKCDERDALMLARIGRMDLKQPHLVRLRHDTENFHTVNNHQIRSTT
jgi:transposase